MKHKINKSGGVYEIVIFEKINYSDYDDFLEATSFVNNDDAQTCIVNIADVDFLDSAALGMFLILNDKTQKNYVDLIIKGAKDKIKKMVKITKIDEIIKFE